MTYVSILEFNIFRLETKINNLFDHKRNKRGLINGLGSIIKSITGNLDSQDAEKYDKLFEKIKQNQHILQEQNLENIAINKKMILKFNNQIENIQHNELVLKSRIMQIDNIIKSVIDLQNTWFIKDIINQLILLSINLIEILEEIETSLTFCNLNELHSSIITKTELMQIIKDTNQNLNYWELSSQITSHCKINKNQIEYLLDIPVYYNNVNNRLLQITPIPNIYGNKMFMINEEKELIILDDKKLFKTHDCNIIKNKYFCKTNYIETDKCIKNIVGHQNNKECEYHVINEAFIIMRIENVNLAIIASTVNRNIKIKCENKIKYQQIKGVYKFETNKKCQIDNYNLENTLSKAKEITFENLNFEINQNQFSNKTLNLKQISKENIIIHELPKIHSIETDEDYHSFMNSFVIILIIIIVLVIVIYKYKHKINFKKNVQIQDLELNSPNVNPF